MYFKNFNYEIINLRTTINHDTYIFFLILSLNTTQKEKLILIIFNY